MRILTRSVIILALLWLEFVLYSELQGQRAMETVEGTKVMLLFLGIVSIAIIIGAIVAAFVIPAIGEFVGSLFFNPNEQVEKDAHADALAKIAQGDYEGAIEEYHKSIEDNPEDMHAISEIVHIQCDKLHDYDAAEKFLADALQKEWPAEQGAFLGARLVDVYWTYKHDAGSARHILTQIAETMPDTKHAANAIHRLHEIDRALANQEAGLPKAPVESPRLPESE